MLSDCLERDEATIHKFPRASLADHIHGISKDGRDHKRVRDDSGSEEGAA